MEIDGLSPHPAHCVVLTKKSPRRRIIAAVKVLPPIEKQRHFFIWRNVQFGIVVRSNSFPMFLLGLRSMTGR